MHLELCHKTSAYSRDKASCSLQRYDWLFVRKQFVLEMRSVMTPRLLVIDDEKDLLLLYQLILEPEGYDVYLAPSLLPQVIDLDLVLPDLIILDYHLGGHGRKEPLLQQLRTSPSTSAIPVILCTADTNVILEQEDFLRESGVRVVCKPFVISVLLQTIQQALMESPINSRRLSSGTP